MPEFSPGETVTAKLVLRNRKSVAFSGVVSLYTGIIQHMKSYSLSAGEEKEHQMMFSVPDVPGVYPVQVAVYDDFLGLLAVRQDVDIVIREPIVVVTLINWPPVSYGALWGLSLWCRVDDNKHLGSSGAIFDARTVAINIPSDWVFPLRFEVDIIDGDGEPVHIAQSFDPYYGYYVEEYVPSVGDYYYNAATSKFEKR